MTQDSTLLASFKDRNKIPDNLIVVYFFFLLLLPLVSKVAFILLLVYVLFTGGFKKAFGAIKNEKYLLIVCGFYLLHVIGLIWSVNLNYGLDDLSTKLLFILAPIAFAGIGISADLFDRIKKSFVISAVLSLIVLLAISFSYYLQTGSPEEFFYTRLSHGSHVTYLTIYLNLSLLFIEEKIFQSKSKRNIYFVSFVFLFIGIQLMSARTSTVVAIATSIAYPLFLLGKNVFSASNRNYFLGLLIIIPVIFFGYLHFNNRFQQVEAEIKIRTEQPANTVQKEEPNSTNIRINLWKNAIQLIRRNPILGVGTGDIKEELVKVYTENNYEYGIEKRTSPHNQFLHTAVILGIVGMLMLSLVLLMPVVMSFRSKEWIYFFFSIIILINCMTESLLEREAGILFFTAFNVCFYLRMREKSS